MSRTHEIWFLHIWLVGYAIMLVGFINGKIADWVFDITRKTWMRHWLLIGPLSVRANYRLYLRWLGILSIPMAMVVYLSFMKQIYH